MIAGRTIGTIGLITIVALITACADADAVDPSSTNDQGKATMLETGDPEIDFYRAEGLPQLHGTACRSMDRAVIGVPYTHSIIAGEGWRGSGDAREGFVRGRGKYGENLHADSNDDDMRLYAYDYYARGRPGELVIVGISGSSSEDGCMIGVLTDEKLRQQLSGDTEQRQ